MYYLIGIKNLKTYENQLEIVTNKALFKEKSGVFFAHSFGNYKTLNLAIEAAKELTDELSENDINGKKLIAFNPSAVCVYRPISIQRLNLNDTALWLHENIKSDITAYTSDERLLELVDEYQTLAKIDNKLLHNDLLDYLTQHRWELEFFLKDQGR